MFMQSPSWVSEQLSTSSVIEVNVLSYEKLCKKILEEAKELKISHSLLAQELENVIVQYRKNESSWVMWFDWILKPPDWSKDYVQTCIIEALQSIKPKKIKNEIDKFYNSLEKGEIRNCTTLSDEREKQRINKIMDMLSTEKIFPKIGQRAYTLYTVMQWMTNSQCNKVKDCILRLKNYCDVEGIKSVIENASINVSNLRALLYEPKYDKISDPNKNALKKSFIKRLKLMTSYIEHVAKEKDFDEKMFEEKYWIRSTGSDPHYQGRHALFLVNKETDVIEKVYKPHDLGADDVVVGKNGIFASLNNLFNENFKSKLKKLGLTVNNEKAFATMDINVNCHTEEFVIKKDEMIEDEAKKYFFCEGMLKVITDAMAVIDLHQDNIMATLDGPLIIDAEVDFFDYSSSNIERAFSHLNLPDEKSRPSTFQIKKAGNESIYSGQAWSKSPYKDMYKKGYNFILDTIKPNINKFADLYELYLDMIPPTEKIRILPFSTSVFADHLQYSIQLPKSKKNNYLSEDKRCNDKQGHASLIVDSIEDAIVSSGKSNSKPFIFGKKSQELKANLNKNKLVKSIKETFDNGTIIAMYCDMRGNIYLDNTIVGEILYKNKKVSRERLVKEMRENFKRVIRTLPRLRPK